MKKIVTLLIIIFSLISCTKDYTNIENLVGTTWQSASGTGDLQFNEDYYVIKFISKTKLELWIKHTNRPNLEKEFDAIYFVEENKIEITDEFDYDHNGTIDGKTLSILLWGSLVDLILKE